MLPLNLLDLTLLLHSLLPSVFLALEESFIIPKERAHNATGEKRFRDSNSDESVNDY